MVVNNLLTKIKTKWVYIMTKFLLIKIFLKIDFLTIFNDKKLNDLFRKKIPKKRK